MRPEDLVGRRIRFIPRRAGYTMHAMDDLLETSIVKCEEPSVNSGVSSGFQIYFESSGRMLYQIARLNIDFEVIDDGEIPYSWRC